MEDRKQKEVEWGNFRRSSEVVNDPEKSKQFLANKKFYSVVRKTIKFQEEWFASRSKDKKVLVLGCGEGAETFFIAKSGGIVTGIDLSDVGVENAKKRAQDEKIDGIEFLVMDAENTTFPDSSFDIITASGVLHHLDIEKAYKEMNRLLKPDGEIICLEPLAYNPLISWYRKRTPHLRTEWEAEHILTMKSIHLAKKYFENIDMKFFHLFTILGVPFRKFRFFNGLLSALEAIDSVILKIPLVRLLAWQVIFVLKKPKNITAKSDL